MEDFKLTAEDVEAALQILHREYFMNVVALMANTPQDDLNYVKVPVVTEHGGTYLISILHVDGPKLSLERLKLAASNVEGGV